MRSFMIVISVFVLSALTGCHHEDHLIDSAIGGRRHIVIDSRPGYSNVVERINTLPAEARCHVNSGQQPNWWQQQNCAYQSSGGQQMMPGMYGMGTYPPPASYPVH